MSYKYARRRSESRELTEKLCPLRLKKLDQIVSRSKEVFSCVINTYVYVRICLFRNTFVSPS